MLVDAGFNFFGDDRASKHFTYEPGSLRYNPDTKVANTYYLSNDDFNVTLYYEPVIYNYQTLATNGIELYRTTGFTPNYYCPDFLLSFSNKRKNETSYFILDAKYSNRFVLREHKTLFNSIKKYHLELSSANENAKIKMIWLLQGKTDRDLWDIEYYHNSSMAKVSKPRPVCGIFNLNVQSSNIEILYQQIKNSL